MRTIPLSGQSASFRAPGQSAYPAFVGTQIGSRVIFSGYAGGSNGKVDVIDLVTASPALVSFDLSGTTGPTGFNMVFSTGVATTGSGSSIQVLAGVSGLFAVGTKVVFFAWTKPGVAITNANAQAVMYDTITGVWSQLPNLGWFGVTASSSYSFLTPTVVSGNVALVAGYQLISCSLGYYDTGTTSANTWSCSACPVGTFGEFGATSCTPCPAGLYNPSSGTATNVQYFKHNVPVYVLGDLFVVCLCLFLFVFVCICVDFFQLFVC